MPVDPFEIKRLSLSSPKRIAFTIYARAIEYFAWTIFNQLLVKTTNDPWTVKDTTQRMDTAVTPQQMAALIYFVTLCDRDHLRGSIVEIGSFRGITTAEIAKATGRKIFAVDPYQDYGGSNEDYKMFNERVRNIHNITHLRVTSGVASKTIPSERICFAFIDAVHDYVNTYFDAVVWWRKIVRGGFLALHDTDSRKFPGTRLAAWRMSRRARIVCHIPGLVILQKV